MQRSGSGRARWRRSAAERPSEAKFGGAEAPFLRHPGGVKRFVWIALLTLLGGGLAVPARTAAAQEAETSVCGRIAAFTAATATTDGTITIGSRPFVLRADALYSVMGQNRIALVVGNNVCLQGARDVAGAFLPYTGIALPADFCGTVMSFSQATLSADGSVVVRDLGIARFVIPRGTDAGADPTGARACFRLGLDARGDAIVTGRTTTLAERTAHRVSVCGLVSAWTAPERVPGQATLIHRAAGSITVGTHTYPIAAGTTYSLVNAPPVVGQPTCLSGSLDAGGGLIEYGAQPGLPSGICGTIAEYRAPTATAAGLLRSSVSGSNVTYTDESLRFAIPAGSTMPPDATSGRYCFTLALGTTGDAVVTGATIPLPGGATAPATTLPNTSTLP